MTKPEHPERLSRKDRERARHRREILAAAERIFSRDGYHATTVEKIAKEAEFSVGTIYNFFEGKDDLYVNVIEDHVNAVMDQFDQRVMTEEDPERAIGALIDLRMTHAHEHRDFIRIVLEAFPCGRMDPAQLLPPRVRETHERYIESVVKLFQRGISQGVFDQADPLYLALCMEGIINACTAYWTRNEPVDPLDVRIAKMKREFLERIKLPVNRSQGANPANGPFSTGAYQ